MTKNKKQIELEQQVGELTQDLQRIRADFENYRKRVDGEKEQAKASGKVSAVMNLLPILDAIDRAVSHVPQELESDPWAQGVMGIAKNLDKLLQTLELKKIDAAKGATFNPELHDAVQFDEDAEGEHEVIVEELQAGYLHGEDVIRPAMVRVGRE